MTATTRALPLNGLYLLCSWAQYPVKLWLPAACSTSPPWHVHQGNVDYGRSQLCYGHTHWVEVNMLPWQLLFTDHGTKMFLSPCTTQTVRMKRLTAKVLGQQQYIRFNFLCHSKEHKHRWTFRILALWKRQASTKKSFGSDFFEKNKLQWTMINSAASLFTFCYSYYIQEGAEIRKKLLNVLDSRKNLKYIIQYITC